MKIKTQKKNAKKAMSLGKVSIIMPNYNSANFVGESIQSIISQTYSNWQLIICDDGSTDNSIEVINSFLSQDNRIMLIQNKYNKGAPGARNSSLDLANGEYIAFLDSDDLWLENRLERHIHFMETKNLVFSYSFNEVIDEQGRKVSTLKAPYCVNKRNMCFANFISCSTAIYKSSIIGKVHQPDIKKRNDFALWLKILNMDGVKEAICFEEITSQYRSNSYGLSSNVLDAIKYFYVCLVKYNKCSKLYASLCTILYLKIIFFKKKIPSLYNQIIPRIF